MTLVELERAAHRLTAQVAPAQDLRSLQPYRHHGVGQLRALPSEQLKQHPRSNPALRPPLPTLGRIILPRLAEPQVQQAALGGLGAQQPLLRPQLIRLSSLRSPDRHGSVVRSQVDTGSAGARICSYRKADGFYEVLYSRCQAAAAVGGLSDVSGISRLDRPIGHHRVGRQVERADGDGGSGPALLEAARLSMKGVRGLKPNARAGHQFRGLLAAEVRHHGGTGGLTQVVRGVLSV